FFLRAEDGVRALIVTGVQTCALPIFACRGSNARVFAASCQSFQCRPASRLRYNIGIELPCRTLSKPRAKRVPLWPGWDRRRVKRSEERRVGKECGSVWAACLSKNIVK